MPSDADDRPTHPALLGGALTLWRAPLAPVAAAALAVAGLVAVTLFVDVSPRVEGEFFFADDDPQVVALEAVRERFPAGSQVILRVADRGGDAEAYRASIEGLTDDLVELPDVRGVFSIANQDPSSPLFGRILLTRDPNATNVVLDVDDAEPETLLPEIEAVVAQHASDALDVIVSGVPTIIEQIRRSLDRDLVVFSSAAVVVFALLVGLVYRDPAIVVGTLSTCLLSVASTLVLVRAVGVPIGLLTANLVTIVFVLTLSHVVFLTANWKRASSAGQDRDDALATAILDTSEPSFWSMVTTLLGFLSLLVATARPLRELGIAGAIGTATAIVAAFAVYPAFLGRCASTRRFASDDGPAPYGGARPVPARAGVLGAAVVVVLVAGAGVPRLDTDPSLIGYFAVGSDIRTGLAEIDADGGTSTLDIVVRDPGGARVDAPAVFAAMTRLQDSLDADPAVGLVLSPPVLIAHARTIPLAGFLPVPTLLDLASSEQLGGVGLGFVTPERDQARFALRMREEHPEARGAVIARLTERVEDAGLEPVLVAGLYDLQRQLGTLIRSSLRIGVGGLLLLFLGVAAIVSRRAGTTLRMWLCLLGIPVVVLGTFAWLGISVDIITSPAANIALAMGADSMIHLVVRARTLGGRGGTGAWGRAVAEIRGPVLSATGIICAGFGIFVLSSFPPTRRFGLAVILGTVAAAVMTLVVLPRLVRSHGAGGSGAGGVAAG